MRRCLLALCFALVVAAQDAPPQYHFLFIVDTSISMADRKQAVLSSMRDLFRSGFSRQIEDGDIIDVWTFDTPNDADPFTTLLWFNRRGGAISIDAGEYIASKKFHRGSHIDRALSELRSILPKTTGLFVALLTDGEEPISGFTFDSELNYEISKLRRDAVKTKKPILVALTAVDGEWSDWRVKLGTDHIDLPNLPKREKPASQKIADAKTEPVVEKPKDPEPEQPVVLNLPPGARLAQFRIPEPAPAPAPAPATLAESVPSPVKAPVQVSTTNVPSAKVPAPVVVELKQPKVQPEEKKLVAQVEPPPIQPSSPPIVRLPTETAPIAEPLTISPIMTALATSSSSAPLFITSNFHFTSPKTAQSDTKAGTERVFRFPAGVTPIYLFMGGGGICVLAAGALLMVRRPSPVGKASLISRSLAK